MIWDMNHAKSVTRKVPKKGKSMRFTIDRIDREMAVCETEEGKQIKLKTSDLPSGAKEGDILRETGNGFAIDEAETLSRKQKMREKLKRLTEGKD